MPYRIPGYLTLLICIIGSYTATNHIVGVWIMAVAGVFGYLFTKYRFPMAPLVLGLILGPVVEVSYRRAWLIYGKHRQLFGRSVTVALLGLVFAPLLVVPLILWG